MGLKKGFFAAWALLLVIYAIAWIVFEMDYRTRAANLYGRGEYARAIDLFNRVIASKSDSHDLAEAHVARGFTRLQLGESAGAVEDAEKGLSLWPQYAFGHLLRSDIKLAAGDTKAALEDCDAALKSDANFPWAYWGRGNVRREMGDLDAALADYDKALQLKPNMVVLAWDRLRPMRTIEGFYVDRSIAKRLKGDLDVAYVDCEAALKLDRKYAIAVLNRGLVLLRQGKEDQAQADFNRFIELRPREKALLEAEVDFARAGVAPKATKVFLARTTRPTDREPVQAEIEQQPEQAAQATKDDAGSATASSEQAPQEPRETGVFGFLKRPLPLYATLVCGIALILIFTGSFLVLKDMRELLSGQVSREYRRPLQLAVQVIQIRRVLCVLTGAGLVAAYFLNKQMPAFLALVLGGFFLSSMNKIGNARKLVTDAKGQAQL